MLAALKIDKMIDDNRQASTVPLLKNALLIIIGGQWFHNSLNTCLHCKFFLSCFQVSSVTLGRQIISVFMPQLMKVFHTLP